MLMIDARRMLAPEPFERVVEALRSLPLDDEVLLIVRQEPLPLYRFLANNRYRYRTRRNGEGSFEVRIWEEPQQAGHGA